jgi:DegV family protein with EDD domain
VCAARAAAAGADLDEVRAAVESAMSRTATLFYVDTLDFLRRGGRIGAASALLGTALAVKPILQMVDGEVVVRDKVRTASRALARLADLVAEFAAMSTVDLAVQHLAAPDRALSLLDSLRGRLSIRESYLSEVGAVLGAHAGPGLVCAAVHRVV